MTSKISFSKNIWCLIVFSALFSPELGQGQTANTTNSIVENLSLNNSVKSENKAVSKEGNSNVPGDITSSNLSVNSMPIEDQPLNNTTASPLEDPAKNSTLPPINEEKIPTNTSKTKVNTAVPSNPMELNSSTKNTSNATGEFTFDNPAKTPLNIEKKPNNNNPAAILPKNSITAEPLPKNNKPSNCADLTDLKCNNSGLSLPQIIGSQEEKTDNIVNPASSPVEIPNLTSEKNSNTSKENGNSNIDPKYKTYTEIAEKLRILSPTEAPKSYIVQPGDTLWDICDQLLDDANWWPKLWTLNPTIKNPNIIEPGMVIAFYPNLSSQEEPKFVAKEEFEVIPISSFVRTINSDISNYAKSWIGKENILVLPSELPSDPDFDILRELGNNGTYILQIPGFISSSSPESVGEIINLESGKIQASKGYIAYGEFGVGYSPKPGEKYLAVREFDLPTNSAGNRKLGMSLYVYSGIVGLSKINRSGIASLFVESSAHGVSAGDILIPFKNINIPINLETKGKQANLESEVLAVENDELNLAGKMQVIYLLKNGEVSRGDEIPIYMPQGGITTFTDDRLDAQLVGKAKVIDITEEGIAAIITQSSAEISVGAKTYDGF